MGPRQSRPPSQPTADGSTGREAEFRDAIQKAPLDRMARLRYLDFLLDQKRNLDALDVCRDAAKALPNDPAIRAALAETLAGTGRVTEAIRVLTPASPAETALRLQLAGLLVRNGEPDRAVPIIQSIGNPSRDQALSSALLLIDARRPGLAVNVLRPFIQAGVTGELLNSYGFALLQNGQYAEAVKVLRQAITESPEIPTLHYYAGSALRLAGRSADLPAAIAEMQQATDRVPTDALFQYELAQGWIRRGSWQEAQQALEQAANQGADFPEIQRDLSKTGEKTGQPIPAAIARARYLQAVDDAPAAVKVLQPLAAQHPSDTKLGLVYSVALHAAGKFPEATAVVERLRKLRPEDTDILWSQYHLQTELKQSDQALATLGALESRLGHDPALLKERAATLQRLARYQEAEELLIQLRDLQPDDPTHHYNLGHSLSLWSTRPDAKKLAETELKRAVELRPDYSEAMYALGQLALGQGKPAEAVSHLRRALDFTPAHPDALRLLGRTYLQMGDKARSEESFQLFRAVKARSDERSRLELPVQQLRDIHRSRLALSRFHLRTGDLTAATRELEIIAHYFPGDVETHRLLGPLYGHARRFQRQFEEREWLKGAGAKP